ncbi:MAG: hypothetical protein RSB61_06510, partial [Clostridia bacterium]
DKKLVYYGIRKKPYTTKNVLKISKADKTWLNSLENFDSEKLTRSQKRFLHDGIVVDERDYIPTVNSLAEAKFCKRCCANDFVIPGLEFNSDGLCAICENAEDTKDMVAVNPPLNEIPPSPNKMYDIAVFYTGGKDSSYLLWYLAKIKNLRVLALTWKIPFITQNAQRSIENAKKCLPNVAFVEWQVDDDSIRKFYAKLYSLQSNTCACPSLAYLLFLPILSSFDVPYLALGNEPAQVKNLYFNNIAPKIAFSYHKIKILAPLINFARIVMFKKPITLAQFNYLATVKQLVFGENNFKKMFSTPYAALDNIEIAIDEIVGLKSSLKSAIRLADRHGKLPRFIHIDFDQIENKKYNWSAVKQKLVEDIGWQDTPIGEKSLHTSCAVEKAKEYSQFVAFREMKNTNIPFSAVELSCAVNSGAISRENAIKELQESSGFQLDRPTEHCIMEEFCKRK